MRSCAAQKQGVAVRRLLLGVGCCNRSATAGTVFDDERLPDVVSNLLAHGAGHGIHDSAGRKRQYDLDGFVRIVLRHRERRHNRKYRCELANRFFHLCILQLNT